MRTCPECSCPLSSDAHPLARYCSPVCAYRVRQRSNRAWKLATAKPVEQRYCVICAAPVASDGNRCCCSLECSRERYRQRGKAYRAKVKAERAARMLERPRTGSCPERARRIVWLLLNGGGWERLYRSRQTERAALIDRGG